MNRYAKTIVKPHKKEQLHPKIPVEDEDVDIDRILDVDIGEVDTSNNYYVYAMGEPGLTSVLCVADGRAHPQSRVEAAKIVQHSSTSTGCPSSIKVDGLPRKKPTVLNHGGPRIQPILPPKTKGGHGWKDLTVTELRVYLGILIYMGIKKEPCRQNY